MSDQDPDRPKGEFPSRAHQWKPGMGSPNPGGRPPSIVGIIRELSADGDGMEPIKTIFAIMRGQLEVVQSYVQKAPGGHDREGQARAERVLTRLERKGVPISERRKAAEWLAEQVHGKAVQPHQIAGADGGPIRMALGPDMMAMSDADLLAYEQHLLAAGSIAEAAHQRAVATSGTAAGPVPVEPAPGPAAGPGEPGGVPAPAASKGPSGEDPPIQ